MTGRDRRTSAGYLLPGVLVAVPLLLALLGPFLASSDTAKDVPFSVGGGHWFGTDFVGRDVWNEVLLGGRSLILIAVAATACTYLIAVPLGLVAGLTRNRALDEVLMRPLDLLLAVPSMLLLLLLVSIAPRQPWVLVAVVALINIPDVVRISRSAALSLSARPAVEVMRLQGESRIRIGLGYVARSMRRTLVTDLGTRFTGATYLVASASFLGVGISPQAGDWAAMVDRNRSGLFVQPWAVVVPAVLIVMLAIGVNLVFDRFLRAEAAR
jgi:peptide/nickel transport system permease protein